MISLDGFQDVVGNDSPIYSNNLGAIKLLPKVYSATVTCQTTLSEISSTLFGNSKLSWLIAVYNGITNDDIYPGMQVYAPDLDVASKLVNI